MSRHPLAPGQAVTIYAKARHGPILRAVVTELYEDSDEYIANQEWWCRVEVVEVVNDRMALGMRPGTKLLFRAPYRYREFPRGRSWRPRGNRFYRATGGVSIVPADDSGRERIKS